MPQHREEPIYGLNKPFAQHIASAGKLDHQEPVIDVANTNASKELGRLAVFIQNNFPGLVGEGKKPVDIATELLTGLKKGFRVPGEEKKQLPQEEKVPIEEKEWQCSDLATAMDTPCGPEPGLKVVVDIPREELFATFAEKLGLTPEELSAGVDAAKAAKEQIEAQVTGNRLKYAIETIVAALKEGQEPGSYYYAWQANIAMAFFDEATNAHLVIPASTFADEFHKLCNDAAKRFLSILIGGEYPQATRLNASEALFGFIGWLTTRPGTLTIGREHNVPPIVDLIGEFMKVQGLPEPREEWNKILKPMP